MGEVSVSLCVCVCVFNSLRTKVVFLNAVRLLAYGFAVCTSSSTVIIFDLLIDVGEKPILLMN